MDCVAVGLLSPRAWQRLCIPMSPGPVTPVVLAMQRGAVPLTLKGGF